MTLINIDQQLFQSHKDDSLLQFFHPIVIQEGEGGGKKSQLMCKMGSYNYYSFFYPHVNSYSLNILLIGKVVCVLQNISRHAAKFLDPVGVKVSISATVLLINGGKNDPLFLIFIQVSHTFSSVQLGLQIFLKFQAVVP